MTEQKRGHNPSAEYVDEAGWIPKENNGVSLTGDPVPAPEGGVGRGLTAEATAELQKKQNPDMFDELAIPGLDEDAVAEGGADPENEGGGCEGGACKI